MSATVDRPSDVDLLEENLVEVGVYTSTDAAAARGLVILATGQPYWLIDGPDGVRLMIELNGVAVARHHLAAYERESAHWPPPPIADLWSRRPLDLITPFLWAVTVLALFEVSGRAPSWTDWGLLDAQAVFIRGEFWRPFTALFLHADAAHVVTNALSGILIFPAVVLTLGRARGWALLAAAAVIGNLAIAALHLPGPYQSLGASTAIFAGVGLLTGRAIRVAWQSRHPHRWRGMFVPFAAGLTVLALHGAGGARVDVGAHLTGFLAGLALGFAIGLDHEKPLHPALRK